MVEIDFVRGIKTDTERTEWTKIEASDRRSGA